MPAVVRLPAFLVLAVVTASFGHPASAEAQASYSTAKIADVALTYVGRWGGEACRDAHRSGLTGSTKAYPSYPSKGKPGSRISPANGGDGQCKSFVNCVVWVASGKTQWLGGGATYFTNFARLGRELTKVDQLSKGDIVQKGANASASPHTFIIVSRIGGTRFWVVDSNSAYDEIVHKRQTTVTLSASVRAFRLGANPQVSSPGQPTSPGPTVLDPHVILNNIVRESGSGTAYYVTTGGPLASSGTLWHWIPDGATYSCLVASGAKVIPATWPQINKLRGAKGQNEGPHAICAPRDSAPVITGINNVILQAGDGRQAAPRVDYRDTSCDVSGGTWRDSATGEEHDFSAGHDATHPAACSNGVGFLTPGYASCTAADGTPGTKGKHAQTIVLRDASGLTSAPFTFYVICE